jgi:mono/diheme cytochrome c family protein
LRNPAVAIYLTGVALGSRTVVYTVALALSGLTGATSCTREAPPAPEKTADAPGLGEVMVIVGRRFEMAGRAAVASRWELAAFEAGELGELFESDVPRAQLPKEGPTAQIPAMASAFLQSVPPDLQKAAEAKDRAKFAAAFERAAGQCNACHVSAAKAFIQVPTVPGQAVPSVDPLPEAGDVKDAR